MILRPYPTALMRAYPVDLRVGNVRHLRGAVPALLRDCLQQHLHGAEHHVLDAVNGGNVPGVRRHGPALLRRPQRRLRRLQLQRRPHLPPRQHGGQHLPAVGSAAAFGGQVRVRHRRVERGETRHGPLGADRLRRRLRRAGRPCTSCASAGNSDAFGYRTRSACHEERLQRSSESVRVNRRAWENFPSLRALRTTRL